MWQLTDKLWWYATLRTVLPFERWCGNSIVDEGEAKKRWKVPFQQRKGKGVYWFRNTVFWTRSTVTQGANGKSEVLTEGAKRSAVQKRGEGKRTRVGTVWGCGIKTHCQ